MLSIPGILRITQKWFLVCTNYYYQDSDENKIQYLLNISCFTHGIHTNTTEQIPSTMYSFSLVTKSYPKPDESKPNSHIKINATLTSTKTVLVKYFIWNVEELGYWSELGHCILTIMEVYQWLGQDFLAPIQSYVDRPRHAHDKNNPFS